MVKKVSCIGGTEVKHNYQPRFDELEPDAMDTFFSMKRSDIKKNKVYVSDVCTACGDVIHRQRGRG